MFPIAFFDSNFIFSSGFSDKVEVRQSFFFEEFAHLHNRMGPSKEVKLEKLRASVTEKNGGKVQDVTGEFEFAIPSYARTEQSDQRFAKKSFE